jgi:hypothetical protein
MPKRSDDMRSAIVTSIHVAIRRCVAPSACVVAGLLPFPSASGQITTDTLPGAECVQAAPAKCPVLLVSMVRLLATPEKFNGRHVQVIGFVHLAAEDAHVYLHREDFLQMNLTNAIPLAFRPAVVKKVVKVNDRYDLIEGTFLWREGIPGGLLTDVVSIAAHDSRAEFMQGFVRLVAPKRSRQFRH